MQEIYLTKSNCDLSTYFFDLKKGRFFAVPIFLVLVSFAYVVFFEDAQSEEVSEIVSPGGASVMELSRRSIWAGDFVDIWLFDRWSGRRQIVYSAAVSRVAAAIWESDHAIRVVGPGPNRKLTRKSIALSPQPGSSALSRVVVIEHQLY